jgi:hypothetical protein
MNRRISISKVSAQKTASGEPMSRTSISHGIRVLDVAEVTQVLRLFGSSEGGGAMYHDAGSLSTKEAGRTMKFTNALLSTMVPSLRGATRVSLNGKPISIELWLDDDRHVPAHFKNKKPSMHPPSLLTSFLELDRGRNPTTGVGREKCVAEMERAKTQGRELGWLADTDPRRLKAQEAAEVEAEARTLGIRH